MTQTATNPQTGETVVLIGNKWEPVSQTATNAAGAKAYLVGDKWHTEESAVPSAPTSEKPPASENKPTGNLIDAVAEPLLKLGSGIIAKPAGDIAGMAKGGYDAARRAFGYGQQGPNAEEAKQAVQGAIQYEPSTQVGASDYNPLNAVQNVIGRAVGGISNAGAKLVGGDNPEPDSFRKMGADATREAIIQAIGLAGMKGAPKGISAAKTTGGGVMNLVDRLLPGGANRSQSRVMADAAGPDIAAIVDALKTAKQGETAGQAAVGVGRREYSALDQLGSKIDPTPHGRMMEAQSAADLDFLNQQAGGLTREQQFATQQALKQAETGPIVQRGQVELGAANQAGETISSLAPRMAQKQESMVQALRGQPALMGSLEQKPSVVRGNDVKAVFEGPATESAQSAVRNAEGKPGWISNADRAQEWAAAAGDLKTIKAQRQMERDFIDRQIGSLESHGLKPLNISAVTGKIDSVLSSPGLRMSDQTKTVLGGLKDKFLEAEQRGNGIPNAHDIYQIRKEGINEIVQQKLAGLDPKASKKLVADLTTQLKPLIDNAIESAGGSGWKSYLHDYSKAMEKVGQTKLAGKLASDYQSAPAQFEKVALGNDPKTVGKIMGKNEPMALMEADPVAGPRYREIAEALMRNKTLAQHATEGAPALSKMVTSEVTGGGRLPGMVAREITITNSILDVLHGRANAKTMQKVAETMRDPVASKKVLEAIIEARKPTVTSTVMPYAVGAQFAPQGDRK